MKIKLLICKWFAWFFVQPWFKITNQTDIAPGRIILRHRLGESLPEYRNRIYIALSPVTPMQLNGDLRDCFYSLALGDFDLEHYPTPECTSLADSGIGPYPNGMFHEHHRSYVLPFSISPAQLTELIEQTKKEWGMTIKSDSRFTIPGSPFA